MVLDFILVAFAATLSIPLWVTGIELLITLLHKVQEADNSTMAQAVGSYKILIPAHNESEVIAHTLTTLLQQKVPADSIIVVADNCTDDTAAIARKLNVVVLERFNDKLRGKGFALDYGITYLKNQSQTDVLIILDADCEINNTSIHLLLSLCLTENRPIQALYLMRNHREHSLKQRIAGFAWLVKNKIRPIAVNKLGIPVTLTGSGMAFPWPVISTISIAHGNIVEDMQLGIDCTLKGFAPVFCEQAVVYSDFPEQLEAEKSQRTRWEHGHLSTIIQQVPKLIKQAIMQKDWCLLGLALDIGVPPLALLIMLAFTGTLLLAVVAFMTQSYFAFFVLLFSFLFFTLMLLMTWWKSGRDYLSFKELHSIIQYIFSKIYIYLTFIFKRQTSWIRTTRDTTH